MAQEGIFGSGGPSPRTEGADVFGSRFGKSTTHAVSFGVPPGQTSNMFQTFSGPTIQPSSQFGSFGEQTSEASSIFGAGVANRGRMDVFIPAFGGGSQTIASQPGFSGTSSTVVGRNFGFGAIAASGHSDQTSNFNPSTRSHDFGVPESVSSSNPFGTGQSSAIFGSSNQSSTSLFAGVPSTAAPAPFGATQPGFAQPVFSANQIIESNMDGSSLGTHSISPSTFPAQSSNIFSTFSTNAFSGSPPTGSGFGTLTSSTGFRKRDSNGALSSNTLFGNQDVKSSVQFAPDSVSSIIDPLTLKQNTPLLTTASLFGDAAALSTPHAGMTFPNSTSSARLQQTGDKGLFGQKRPDTSHGGSEKVVSKFELPVFHMRHYVGSDPRVSSSHTSINPSASESNESAALHAVGEEPASSDQSQNILFGKPIPPAGALFGKTATSSKASDQFSRSYDTFGKVQERGLFEKKQRPGIDTERGRANAEQSSTIAKSLTKWNRGKDISQPDRKRRELTLSSESQSDLKKSRFFEGVKPVSSSASSPASLARSSLTRMSVDDLTVKNSIVVKDIPAHLNRGPVLRKHFSHFGTITRLQSLAMKRAANITFKTHEEALAAKNDGKYLSPDSSPVSIFWRATSKPKSPDGRQTQVGESQRKTVPLKKKIVPGSVEDELASLAELPDFQEEFQAAPKQPEMPKSVAVRKRSPSPTPPQAPQVLDVDVAKGLLKSISRARAKDTSERVAILDSRDKLLKLLRGRQQSDLATAKAFVGTCPDMCPEKERFDREDTRRLSVYEVIPSTMTSLTGLKSQIDHVRAVKEYSRSSADQEEPLSHELRPLPVLVNTMNYLLSQIADLGEEGKWAEWYDFLWNRTRGIRKDITQQQLCDVQVAELLEKCSRFHIFCSERLCEEDMMTFDAKINNENLTKCLQTLKELYDDLEKRGTFCPNEAEFRGYMVLMNLNEGEILREIQQLRPEIRDSPHINFAVQVYNALNSSNYVRFFRLIEEKATFLIACVLHRYFNQIRSKALLIIMKAHGALGKNIVLYPVEEMIRLLCFEDARDVESFCFHYCLSLKGADVVLDSKAYTELEGSLPQTRSQSLIEVKQEIMSVGEVINGSPLAPLQMPYPSSSFDQDGVFIMTPDIQEALESSKLFRTKAPLPVVEEIKVPRKERMVYSNEVVKSIARTVILEVIDASIEEIAKESVKEDMDLSVVIMSEVGDIISSSLQESLRQIAQEVCDEQELMLRKRLEEELVVQRQRACHLLCDEIVDNAVVVMTKEIAEKEMSLVKAEVHRHRIERCSQQYSDDMLLQVVDETIEDVAEEVYDVDVVMKRERLEATEKLVMVIRCRRFLQAWRFKYLAQIRVKRAMLDFPSAPSVVSLHEQIHRLVPVRPDVRISHKSFYIGERAKLSIESPMNVIQDQLHLNVHLSMASARHMLGNLLMWRPLDITQTVNPQLQRAFRNWTDLGLIDSDTASLQWKLIISIPKIGPSSSTEESTFSKWIRTKMCRSAEREIMLKTAPHWEGEILSNYQINEAGSKRSSVSTGICVRCFHGIWTDSEEIHVREKYLLKGTSAVMFVLPCAENLQIWNQSSQHTIWKTQKRRLLQVLKEKPGSPAVPLVLIVPRLQSESSVSVTVLEENLQLSELHKQSLITAVHVAQPHIGDLEQPLQVFGDWTTQLTNCLRFAASNIPAPPKLRAKPVSDYVEDVVVELYRSSVYQDLRSRTRHQLLHQSPNTLLSLYNEVVDHAAMVCASGSLAQMSWPAPEFDHCAQAGHPTSLWNTEAYMCDLYELVSKMRLPYFRYIDMEADDWSAVCHDVWLYVAAVTKKDNSFAKIYLHQQVAELLSRSKKTFHQFCWLADKDGPCQPTYINTAWTDLIDACIHYKLVLLRTGHFTLRRHEDEDESAEAFEEPEEVIVYYQEADLDDWEAPQIWFDALRDTDSAEHGQLKSTVEKAAEVGRDDNITKNMETSTTDEDITTPAALTVQSVNVSGPRTDKSISSSWTNLKIHLEQERAASEKYEQTLESCLSQSNTSFEMEDTSSSLVPFLSPIKFYQKTSPQERTSRGGQAAGFSARKHNGRFDFSTALTASQSSPYRLEVLTPGSRSVTRLSETEDVGRESAAGGDFGLPPTLSERVLDLQHMVLSEKQAQVLFEMKLKSILDPV